MIERKVNLKKAQVEADERSLLHLGYTKATGSPDQAPKPRQYTIVELPGKPRNNTRYRLIWNNG
ncbi:MAG: hypothetical protein K8T26_07740 [Lentisphaerae bacterium]|nr:hypothetical protein [Lentisphaerota bacterium]